MLHMLGTITAHQVGDVLMYLCFVGGQLLFVLKRAASAIRNPTNVIRTRWDYIKNNWDVLIIRALLESPLYVAWRHIGFAGILGLFHIDTSTGWLSALVSTGAGSGAIAAAALGYAADSFLDGASQWQKIPDWLKNWIHENVPPAPTVVTVVKTGDTAVVQVHKPDPPTN